MNIGRISENQYLAYGMREKYITVSINWLNIKEEEVS